MQTRSFSWADRSRSAAIPVGLVALVAVSATAIAFPVPGDAPDGAFFEPQRYVIRFRDGIPEGLAPGDLYLGGRVLSVRAPLDSITLELRPGTRSAAAAPLPERVLREAPEVLEVAPAAPLGLGGAVRGESAGEVLSAAFSPDDPLLPSQEGLSSIRAPRAWDTTRGAPDVAICDVGTGVRYTHEDLAGPRWLGGWDFANKDADPRDDHGEGTLLAGIAAATIGNGKGIAGVANVGYYAVKSFDSEGKAWGDEIADGILWCADNTLAQTVIVLGFAAVNDDPEIRGAVRHAHSMGKVLVSVPTWSPSRGAMLIYPARYPEVIAVGCLTTEVIACTSRPDPKVEVSAPGHNIPTTTFAGDSSYDSYRGITLPLGFAAGVLALGWSAHPQLSNTELRSWLAATADEVRHAGRDVDSGFGEVDALCLVALEAPCQAPAVECATPGPTAGGYRCLAIEPSFHSIGQSGSLVRLNCGDCLSAPIPLGFDFPFFAGTYATVRLSSNGFLTFGESDDAGCCEGALLPDASGPNAIVAGYWGDLTDASPGEIRHVLLGQAPERTFLVQWASMPHEQDPQAHATFQIALHEATGDVSIHLEDVRSDGGVHVTGIEDATGMEGLTFRHGSFSEEGLSLLFTRTPPETIATFQGREGSSGWWRSPVQASLTCLPASGDPCERTESNLDGSGWTLYGSPFVVEGDGVHALDLRSFTVRGARERPGTAEVKVDVTEPLLDVVVACPVPGNRGWCRSNVATAKFEGSDATSGLASFACGYLGSAVPCNQTLEIRGGGNKHVYATGLDVAGNPARKDVIVYIDAIPPEIRLTQSCDAAFMGFWCAGDVTMAATHSDSLSGLGPIRCTVEGEEVACAGTRISTSGAHSYTVTAEDGAGNVATQTFGVRVDKERPLVSLSVSCPLPGDNGWCRDTAVTARPGASDAHSGVESIRCYRDGARLACDTIPFGRDGRFNVTVEATDGAGNVGSRTWWVLVDSTPPRAIPRLEGTLGGAGWYRSPVTVVLPGSDDTSGVASYRHRVNGGPVETNPGRFVLPDDGTYALQTWAVDVAGNAGSPVTREVRIDQTPPATFSDPTGTRGDDGWWRSKVRVSLWAEDPVSGVLQTWTKRGDADAEPYQGLPFVFEPDGTHPLDSWSQDVAGNVEPAHLERYRVDKTPPATHLSLDGSSGKRGWRVSDVVATLAAQDATSGIRVVRFTLDDLPQAEYSAPVKIAGDGVHSLRFSARDVAGNEEPTQAADTRIDTVAPDAAVAATCDAPGNAGWCRGPVRLGFSATDATSGLFSFACDLDGAAFPCDGGIVQAEGDHAATATAEDVAGHGTEASASFRIDAIPPVTTPGVDGPEGLGGWHVGPVSVSLACEDPSPGSGCARTDRAWNGDPLAPGGSAAITDDGRHVLRYRSVDVAGNPEVLGELPVLLDATPPTLSVALEGLRGGEGWWRGDVTVTLACDDATSGVARFEIGLDGVAPVAYERPPVLTGEGVHEVVATCADVAGNPVTFSEIVRIDSTAPSTSESLTGLPGLHGWFVGPVRIALACDDPSPGSGCALTERAWNPHPLEAGDAAAVAEDGRHLLRFRSTDVAGNAEAGREVAVHLDATLPVVAIALDGLLGNEGWWRSDVTATLTCEDATSGVGVLEGRADGGTLAPYHAPLVLSGDGVHEAGARCQDRAGNEAAATESARIDGTPPTTTPLLAGPPGLDGWFVGPVAITLPCEDPPPGSGCALTERAWNPHPLEAGDAAAVAEDGRHLLRFRSTDVAGNAEAGREVAVHLDATLPVMAIALDGLLGNEGWWRSDVTAAVSCEDVTSGVGLVEARADDAALAAYHAPLVLSGDGVHEAGAQCRDRAGNEAVATASARIDATPPVTTPLVAGLQGLRGWYVGPVSIALPCEDPSPGSGCAATERAFNGLPLDAGESAVVAADGLHFLLYRSTDVAGNVEPTQGVPVPLDATPPTLALALEGLRGNAGWWRSSVSVSLACADATSAVERVEARVNEAEFVPHATPVVVEGDGVHVVEARCFDHAGNVATARATVRIDATAPTGAVLAPPAGVGKFAVRWSAADALSGVGVVVTEELRLGGLLGDAYRQACASTVGTGTEASGECERSPEPAQYCFRVVVEDAAGNRFVSPAPEPGSPLEEAWALLDRCTVALPGAPTVEAGSGAIAATAPRRTWLNGVGSYPM